MPDSIVTGVALSREYLTLKYEKTPDLQREFGGVESYIAFMRADAQGRAHRIVNRIVTAPRPGK